MESVQCCPQGCFLYGRVTTHAGVWFTPSGTVSLLPYWWNILKRISHTSLYSQGSVFFKACVFQEFARLHQQNLPILALNVLVLGSYELPNLNYTQLALKVKFFSKKTIVSENTVYKSVFSTFVARKMWCECGLEPHSFNLFFRFFGIAFQLFKAPRNVLIVLVFCKKVFPQCNRVVIKTL